MKSDCDCDLIEIESKTNRIARSLTGLISPPPNRAPELSDPAERFREATKGEERARESGQEGEGEGGRQEEEPQSATEQLGHPSSKEVAGRTESGRQEAKHLPGADAESITDAFAHFVVLGGLALDRTTADLVQAKGCREGRGRVLARRATTRPGR